jgi:pimeloyl-ACP methyl ester carboxylesterase
VKRRTAAAVIGAGLATMAAGYVAKQRIHRERTRVDDLAGDAVWFDLDAVGVEHHRIASHDGGELHVVELGPEDARPILLLHGITLQARIWGYQFRDLSDRYRVLAADLRGHGASTAGTDGFGLDRIARDVVTTLEALDLRDAIVVGHSMGGMATMQFAGDHPDVLAERVAGLAFVATTPIVPFPAFVQRLLLRVDAGRLDRLPMYRFRPGDVSYAMARRAFGRHPSPLHVELTRELLAECAGPTMIGSGFGMVAHDAEQALAATRTPSLVVGGECDNLLPPAMARRIAELLPDSELHVLEGCGHQIMLERPKELAALLDAFAARLTTELEDEKTGWRAPGPREPGCGLA